MTNLGNSKEFMIFRYWYFKDIGYGFELFVWNGCHNLLMMAYELENVAVLNIKGTDYRFFI